MKYIKALILMIIVSVIGFGSWLALGKKPVQNIPLRATLVVNYLINDRGMYET